MSREPDDVQQRRRALGQQLATFRQAAELTQDQLAKRTYFDRSRIAHLERGTGRASQRFWAAIDAAVGADGALVAAHIELETAKAASAAQERARELAAVRARADRFRAAGSTESASIEPAAVPPVTGSVVIDRRTVLCGAAAVVVGLQDAELLRRELADAVDHAAMSEANLEDWEHAVHRYGLAARYRPATSLLVDLTADFTELRRLLDRRRSILAPTRLTRIVAQLAKLMAFSLNRLDQPAAARNWARIAKQLAKEAGDSQLHAGVLNEEAVTHYYHGNLVEAVSVAAQAQHVAGRTPCANGAYAAALEARAQAALGRAAETRTALDRAERALGGLNAQDAVPSAFGYYSEARFSFHAGNAFTHLGKTTMAWEAQERALALYPDHDFDRTLVMLDRADCLAQSNDVPAAVECVTRAVVNAGAKKRDPMIDNRARQVLAHLPGPAARLPAVRELHDLLKASAV